MRRSLPIVDDKVVRDALDLVEIAIPCEVPWASMRGDEQVRHCGQCRQNVYNVAALTRAEAMRLVGARACLRIYRRPDNTVLTSDCRERLRAARKKGLLIFAGTLLIVAWAQICAQFVGIVGLKRLLGGADHAMGAPVPLPGQVGPARPLMGLPPPGEAEPALPRRGHATHGLPPHRTSDGAKGSPTKGKIAFRGLDD